MSARSFFLFLVLSLSCILTFSKKGRERQQKHNPTDYEELFASSALNKVKENDTVPASVISWDTVESKRRFSLLTVAVDHNIDSTWYIPSLHDKFSAGWNRSVEAGFLNRPHACGIRFFGVGLEKSLEGYIAGGTGYLTLKYKGEDGVMYGLEMETNETKKVHCYYMTNKNYGSEFIDNPKTLGIVVYCPVSFDLEVGEYAWRKQLVPGYYCRVLAEYVTNVELHLRPSNFEPPINSSIIVNDGNEIHSALVSVPAAARRQYIKEQNEADPRPHAVCTVQSFRNPQSGKFISFVTELSLCCDVLLCRRDISLNY